MRDAGLVPRFAQLPGWDPFRSRERLTSLWSSAALPTVTTGAAIAYRTLFQTLRRLVVGRTLTVRSNGNDLTLTVTEFDFRIEVRGLAVGQLGDALLVAENVDVAGVPVRRGDGGAEQCPLLAGRDVADDVARRSSCR